jgi:glycosyltransferase involved in cell wall biosynthesis
VPNPPAPPPPPPALPALPAVDVAIPALNEEASLPRVLAALPRPPVRRVVVADNGSSDGTARVAREGGAVVVPAARRGYGSACLAALDWLRQNDPPDIVVFVDADFSDHPEELPALIAPILAGGADLVIGSRVLGRRERGALLPQARAGNLVACALIRLLYGHRYTDLGPFRAIRWPALERLAMSDPDFGWTAEMQVKALRLGLRVAEVPVSYRRRVGVSKITGTVVGTVRAGYKILWTVLRHSRGAAGGIQA